ncbi:MAG: hypothetical protein HY517_01685 [Candidatus Aenigmarchaeota archaeon]|nr:hypothetical protein [Candidatus Aenigmarchaeota archaeon]
MRGLGAYARVPDVPIDAYYITSGPDSFAYVSDVRREIAKERRRKFGPLSIPSLERLRLYSEVALGKMNARISCIKPATVFFDAGRIDKSSGRMEFDVPKDFMESLFQGFDVGSAYGMIELVDAYREIMKIAA